MPKIAFTKLLGTLHFYKRGGCDNFHNSLKKVESWNFSCKKGGAGKLRGLLRIGGITFFFILTNLLWCYLSLYVFWSLTILLTVFNCEWFLNNIDISDLFIQCNTDSCCIHMKVTGGVKYIFLCVWQSISPCVSFSYSFIKNEWPNTSS